MISDDLMSSLNDFVSKKMGLCFPADKKKDLERAILEAYGELGFKDVESCINWLITSKVSRKHIETLASHLTIGETYFFRNPEVFDALKQHVFPELIISREKSKYLRFWSAGCSSGEEAYSIAMLLSKMIPDISDWNITILATDINNQSLEKGRRGVYSRWSFRSTPESIYRNFEKTKDGFRINEDLKKMVTFDYLNLVEDVYPSVINNTNAMDIIFCRNVLMYFMPGAAKKVIEKLYLCLNDGGFLAITPAEAPRLKMSEFEITNFKDTVLYKKNMNREGLSYPVDIKITVPHAAPFMAPSVTHSVAHFAAPPSAAVPAVKEKKPTSYEEALLLYEKGYYTQAAQMLKDALPNNPLAQALFARILANQGKLDDAKEMCEKAIACDKLNPLSYYLHAVISQELGDVKTAIASLRRAIYLDQDFVLAYYSLGNLLKRERKNTEARKCFDNTLMLLGKLDPKQALLASEGITAGRLSEIVTTLRGGNT